jgi:hypothetical protein
MARQTGAITLRGTLGNITFYEMNGKRFARRKRNISRKRILHDKAFAKTRAYARDFSTAARAGKLVRELVKRIGGKIKDGTVTRRLLQKMILIQKYDTLHATGSRKISNAMRLNEAKSLLHGFEFNLKAPISKLLRTILKINTESGTILIEKINVKEDMKYP